jgi:hypothetical protein
MNLRSDNFGELLGHLWDPRKGTLIIERESLAGNFEAVRLPPEASPTPEEQKTNVTAAQIAKAPNDNAIEHALSIAEYDRASRKPL